MECDFLRRENLGGTKVMFWSVPWDGHCPPGLGPVGPKGALKADTESQRALVAMGLSLGLLREMT